MSIRIAFTVCTSLLLAAAAPSAPAPTHSNARASESDTTQVVQFDDEKVICRRDKATGSRVTAKRVCMTARQWDTQRMEDRRKLEQGQAQRTLTDNATGPFPG